MRLETLYKKDSKGVVREWSIYVEGDKYTVVHGVKGGQMQTKSTLAKPKNAGRANATTAERQAELEAQAKWTEQLQRNGYKEWDRLGDVPAYLEPMLALDATKVGHRVDWARAVAQPKLNGVRCLWRPDLKKLQSRKGTFYEAPEHVIEQLQHVEVPFDGELYIHGVPLNEILGASRKWNPLTDQLEFHVFDLAAEGAGFLTRECTLRSEFINKDLERAAHLRLVGHRSLTKDSLDAVHNEWVQDGYEGLMIRHADGLYVAGRSPDLFKYKKFLEEDFMIVAVHEDKDGGAVLEMVTYEGKPFRSRPRGSLQYRQSLLDGACIGKLAAVRFFEMTTAERVPQFPVVVAIGDEK